MKKQYVFWRIFSGILLLIFVLSFWSCGGEDEMSEEEKAKFTIIATFKNIKRIYSEEGILKIKIEAPIEYIYQNQDLAYPENFRISMYEPNGTITTTLTADSGRLEKVKKLYHAYGNVEVINHEKKQKVNTPELHYNQFKREIFTEEKVAIKTPNETLYGVGMISNDKFSKYTIKKPTGNFVYKERSQGFERPDSTDMLQQKPKTPYSNFQENPPKR